MNADHDWTGTDLYAVLGVPPDASDRQIRDAYRLAARESHPDRRPGDPVAEERFKQINLAYEVLVDPVRRAAYDRSRRLGGGAPPGATAARRRRSSGPVNIPVQHVRGDYLRDARDLRGRRTSPFGPRRPGGPEALPPPALPPRPPLLRPPAHPPPATPPIVRPRAAARAVPRWPGRVAMALVPVTGSGAPTFRRASSTVTTRRSRCRSPTPRRSSAPRSPWPYPVAIG